MKKYLLPESGRFYKANLHCHSDLSDGRLSPEELKRRYMAHGYSIIAFTDHDILLPHTDLASDDFLPLHGYEMEITEETERGFAHAKTCHMCLIALEPDNLRQVCWHREKYLFSNAPRSRHLVQFDEDCPDYERVYTPACINDMMRQGREHGFFVTYNHPTWSLEDYRDYIAYDGMHAMEIINYGCWIDGLPEYNTRVYDDMLRAGKRIFCLATDDNHNLHPDGSPLCDSYGGFTMIKAESLDYRTITRALEMGHFYASQGPEIHELWYEDGYLHIVCSPAKRIEFRFSTRGSVMAAAADCETLTSASACVAENADYVRVTVTDAEGKHAHTNAYFVDDLIT